MDFGRYRVLRRLGRGGMAEVVEAVAYGQDGFSRRVAIKKILPGHESDPSFARMFLDEARIASRLHHSCILAVLDYGVMDDQPFQVLELVDGLNAQELARRGRERGEPPSVAIALHICREIAHALSHAHTASDDDGAPLGIVHRDVSPTNFLVSRAGDVKLADFGVAFCRDRLEETSAGVAKGKLGYMAPEQAVRGPLDARADLFGLGCSLHALLTGRSPLAADDQLARVLAGSPPELDPALPDDVREIVARATRPARTQRFESATAMAAALGQALARRAADEPDPRSALGRWFERVCPAPGSGASRDVDRLFLVDVVLSDAGGGVRRFTSTTVAARGTPPGTAVVGRPRSRRPFVIAGAIVLGIAAMLGLRPWAGPSDATDSPHPVARASPPPRSPPAPAPGPTVTAVSPRLDPAPSGATPRPPPRRPSPAHGASPRSSDAGPGVASGPPPPAEPGTEDLPSRGHLLVAGERAFGSQIVVDGRPTGTFAPTRLSLPLGSHEVALLGPDGRVVAHRTVVITVHQTRRDPLRWLP